MLIERVLHTSISTIDNLVGGFRSSKVALFEGNSSYPSNLLHLLCVKAVSELDEEVVWIDGGNTVDPYALSALCKRMRLDKRDILSRVNISRAFTAYQLVTLIDERLEEEVRESSPAMVIVSSLTDMFLDKDMKWMEAYQLLRRCAEDIGRVTRAYETISLVTDRTPGHVPHNERMAEPAQDRGRPSRQHEGAEGRHLGQAAQGGPLDRVPSSSVDPDDPVRFQR